MTLGFGELRSPPWEGVPCSPACCGAAYSCQCLSWGPLGWNGPGGFMPSSLGISRCLILFGEQLKPLSLPPFLRTASGRRAQSSFQAGAGCYAICRESNA